MTDKIIAITGGGQKDGMADAVRTLKKDKKNLIEYVRLVAELEKAKYDALIEQGFTPEQAIILAKNPMNT